MKLKKLSLQNFRSHKDISFELPRLLLVTGRNSSGKTSILDALTWNLAGQNQYTDSKGAGSSCLIMDGETRALVETVVETSTGEHIISRAIPHQLSVDGSRGGIRRSEELLSVLLAPVKPSSFALTMNAERILKTMSDGERRKFLSEMVGVTARTAEQKVTDFLEWLPTIGVPVDSPQAVAAIEMLKATSNPTYLAFYALRRDNNVRISALEPQLKEVPTPQGEGDPATQLASLTKRLALLELEAKMAERTEGIENSSAVITRPNLEAIRSKMDNLKVILAAAQKTATVKEERIAFYDKQKGKLVSAAKQCPVFMRECPLSKEEIGEAVKATDVHRGREVTALEVDKRKVTSAQEAVAAAEAELTAAREQLELYKDLWNGGNITFDKVRKKEEIEAEVKNINERMAALRKYENDLLIYKENESVRVSLAACKEKKEPLELLVQGFAPAGIPSMLLSEHLPRLEALATQASKIITRNRYEITFSAVDGELDISVISESRKRPIHTLSTSEVVWVSLILQHVANKFSGSSLLVLDEASILDEAMQEGLQDFLLDPELGYENIIVCATTDREDFLPRLTGDGVKRVRL